MREDPRSGASTHNSSLCICVCVVVSVCVLMLVVWLCFLVCFGSEVEDLKLKKGKARGLISELKKRG